VNELVVHVPGELEGEVGLGGELVHAGSMMLVIIASMVIYTIRGWPALSAGLVRCLL
jgi:hypothetical protein